MLNIDRYILKPTMKVFGEEIPVTLIRARSLVSVCISGVFDEAYAAIQLEGASDIDSLHITTAAPVLGVRLAAIPGGSPKQADQLRIRGKLYTVKEVQPDGHGWALLTLNLAGYER